jgi:hypothetical protein
MKKIFMMICMVAGSSLYCVGQEAGEPTKPARDSRSKLHFGLKAGLNHSNVYDEEGEQFAARPKNGFAGGAFISIPLGKYLGVQPEVLISQKGFKATGAFLGTTYEMKRTTTFLDVPLLVAFKPATFLTFVGGPQYSYLLKQTDVFMSSNSAAVQEEDFQNDDIRKNILSGSVGGDININHLVFSARYNFDLQRNHGDGTSNEPRYKNRWVQVTVGYRF